jgi:hypothetical protein
VADPGALAVTRARLAALLVLALLAAAPSAHARVLAIADHGFDQLTAADGAAFYRISTGDDLIIRLDIRTGQRNLVYKNKYESDYVNVETRAGGDRLALMLSNGCINEPCREQVLSLPTRGGKATVVASGDQADDCPSDVWLAGVTSAGRVVVDEADCNSRPGRYPGTLYAYRDGERALYGRDRVLDPLALDLSGKIVATGGRYVSWHDAQSWRNEPSRMYLVDPRAGTSRRLAQHAAVSDVDLNDAGDVLVTMGPRRGPYAGKQVVRLYPHGRRARNHLAPKDGELHGQLCGRRLAMFEVDGGRYRLLVRDRPTGPQRVAAAGEAKGDVIVTHSACDEHTFLVSAFTANPGGFSRDRLHAYSLDP